MTVEEGPGEKGLEGVRWCVWQVWRCEAPAELCVNTRGTLWLRAQIACVFSTFWTQVLERGWLATPSRQVGLSGLLLECGSKRWGRR